MKQKLKLLFAFLRGLKGHLVDTSITFDRFHIEDWDDTLMDGIEDDDWDD